MAGLNDNRPIIIKRKKIIKGGGHHGGAWKVAYADFVTAMMAFFLLMWLLNATTEKQRKGLSDYFNPTIPISRESAGGAGIFGGDNIFSQEVLAKNGSGADSLRASDSSLAVGDTGVVPPLDTENTQGEADQKFTEIESLLRGDSGESTVADELLQHIATRVTDEGLIIDLFDVEGSPLFEEGSGVPTRKMEQLLEVVAEVVSMVSNPIAVKGHTDSRRADGRDAFVLSSNRAQVARQRLLANGVSPDRIQRVTGNADRSPVSPDAPATRNRRVEIILLRRGK